eukprot:scaffold2732_cov346-Pavlova_lutheri.AAC.2
MAEAEGLPRRMEEISERGPRQASENLHQRETSLRIDLVRTVDRRGRRGVHRASGGPSSSFLAVPRAKRQYPKPVSMT